MSKIALLPMLLVAAGLAFPVPAAQATDPGLADRYESDEALRDRRGEVLDWINATRASAGLEPLAADPRLFEVAQTRAETLAAAGSVETDAAALQKVSRALHGAGYEAHRWTERAILGYDDPVRMVRNWGAGGDASFVDTTLGPYEDLGVGIAPADDGALAISLLFAVPRATELTRVTEPLRDLDTVRRAVLQRTNRAREEEGQRLVPVRENDELNRAAQRYAERMLAEGFYAHVAPDGGTPSERVAAVGYGPVLFLGENLAQGLFEPEEVVERWMNSSDHRRNILHPRAEEVGIGMALGDTDEGFRVLWVQIFGRRGR
jgi:uncharacterized protein YkwD